MENKKFIVTIIILIIIIAGLGGFIAVDKLVLNKKEQEEKTTQVGDVEVNLTVFEHINDTLTLFNKAFNDSNSKFFGYLYTKREINTSNFDKSAAIYVSMYNNFITTNTPFIILAWGEWNIAQNESPLSVIDNQRDCKKKAIIYMGNVVEFDTYINIDELHLQSLYVESNTKKRFVDCYLDWLKNKKK